MKFRLATILSGTRAASKKRDANVRHLKPPPQFRRVLSTLCPYNPIAKIVPHEFERSSALVNINFVLFAIYAITRRSVLGLVRGADAPTIRKRYVFN